MLFTRKSVQRYDIYLKYTNFYAKFLVFYMIFIDTYRQI